jgi:hypothetical protein
MQRLGLRAMVRGHEKRQRGLPRGLRRPEARLLTLFSAGGKTNDDLPPRATTAR